MERIRNYRSCISKEQVEKYKGQSCRVDDFSNHAFSVEKEFVEKAMRDPANKNLLSDAVKDGGREL